MGKALPLSVHRPSLVNGAGTALAAVSRFSCRCRLSTVGQLCKCAACGRSRWGLARRGSGCPWRSEERRVGKEGELGGGGRGRGGTGGRAGEMGRTRVAHTAGPR